METIVTVLGLSGLRNAYRSVLSALGSSEISGASRWLEAVPALGPEPTTAAASAEIVTAPRAAAASAAFFMSHTPGGRLTALVRPSLEIGSIEFQAEPIAALVRTRGVLAYAQPVTVRSRDLAHLSDEALVALVSRSDESALAELYDRVGGTAYGLAYRILRDESLAEDAVQEAFLGLWRSAGSFIPERAKASTWILTLVHRRAVDLVRREQRRRTEPLEGAPEPSEGSAEEAAWLRLERARVQTALAELPDQQREAIELAYYGGYTQSELAERLGEPLGTIKSRMFSGLSRLRQLLDSDTDPGGAERNSWTFTS